MDRDFFVHDSSYIDENVNIGEGTKIWHFSHIQSGAVVGNKCSIGQNVNIANNVKIGNHVKIQNNVSVYEGVELEDYVFCGPSMVFTNIKVPRSEFPQKGSEFYVKTLVKKSIKYSAAGAASIHKNQTANPPSTAPKLFPLPPIITITQIKKVYLIGL